MEQHRIDLVVIYDANILSHDIQMKILRWFQSIGQNLDGVLLD